MGLKTLQDKKEEGLFNDSSPGSYISDMRGFTADRQADSHVV